MRPSRSILAKALTMMVLAGVLASGSAFAQFYDPAVHSLGLTSDVQRSPRLLGMGSLSISVPDHYQRLTLWDFAHNLAGIEAADTSSTLDLRPGSSSAVTAYDMTPGLVNSSGGFREDLAGRSTGLPFDLVHRDGEGNAYGAIGTVASVRTDQPLDNFTESRESVSHPEVLPFLAGPFPYFGKGKLKYALSFLAGKEQVHRQFRDIVSNDGGDFISLDGEEIPPPDYFQPTDYDVRTLGYGVAASYPVGKNHVFALNVSQRGDRIQGSDALSRSSSQVTESRPTDDGQATLVGHFGKSFEYGIDGHAWTATSQQDWVFTISSGSGVPPLEGRGKLLERDARGTSMNDRARWTSGKLELDGQLWTSWSRVKLTPPAGTDRSSFNRFLNQIYYRVGADTLMLPDSIVANQQEDHATGFGLGASWKLHRGVAGVEYHWSRDAYDQTYAGVGPRQLAWDVRGGLEYKCSDMITGRVGAGFGWFDQDDNTKGNEWTTRSGSLGLGIHPKATSWSFEAGYSLLWLQTDFGDPQNHRGSRQHLESLVHWSF